MCKTVCQALKGFQHLLSRHVLLVALVGLAAVACAAIAVVYACEDKAANPDRCTPGAPVGLSAGSSFNGPYASAWPLRPASVRTAALFAQLQVDLTVHVFAAPALRLEVNERADWQATAREDGLVELSAGLDSAGELTEDELYAILAHEAFHVVHRDGEVRACGFDLQDPAVQHTLQTQELAADRAAQDLLVRVGRPQDALQSALQKLQARERTVESAATHPSMKARVAALAANRP